MLPGPNVDEQNKDADGDQEGDKTTSGRENTGGYLFSNSTSILLLCCLYQVLVDISF